MMTFPEEEESPNHRFSPDGYESRMESESITSPAPSADEECRLDETASIDTSSSSNMTQVGFACWGLGLITLFRPCFVFLVSLLSHIKDSSYKTRMLEKYALPACYFWFTVLMIVFFILGFIPVFATTIKKRYVLLIHPWALMLLYLDVVVWSVITVCLHLQLNSLSPYGQNTVAHAEHVIVCFVFIYIDILTYFVVHYVFATYYIVAELTIIEKFY